jgi:hypothetical protein
VGVVDHRDQELVGAMDLEGFLDQEALAAMVVAVELDLKGLAEDAQGVVIGVKGAVDDRGDETFGVVIKQGLFEHGFAGARFAQDQAQAALLGVNAEDVKDLLLMRQERDGLGVEGIAGETEVGADHRIGECGWVIYDWVGGSGLALFPSEGGRGARGFRSLATGSRGRAWPMRSPL